MKLAWLLWLASVLPAPVQEHTCLAATVYLEARDQTQRGQSAVAEVAMRRLASGRYGDTVCEVVLAYKQFAPGIVSHNTRMKSMPAWERAWTIAGRALAMWSQPAKQRMEIVPGADHFYAYNLVQPEWARGEPVAIIGDHAFYRVGL